MKNVMITGGAGFIGSNYVRYALAAHPDWHILVLDKLTYAGNLDNLQDVAEKFKGRYSFVQADIADREVVFDVIRQHRIDTIVNFAAESHVDRSILDPDAFIMTDVYGTYVLLEAAREFGLERFAVDFADPKADVLSLARAALTEREAVRQQIAAHIEAVRASAAAQFDCLDDLLA
jgi:dTDP-glucose 4,6-dehydratase